jgi:hypothetical protein
MKKTTFLILITLLISAFVPAAFAAKIGEDKLIVGKSGSTADKFLQFGTSSQGVIKFDASLNKLRYANDGSTFNDFISGVPALSEVSKTSAYTLTSTDDVVYGDASGGAFTLTLPSAASNSGKIFRLKKTDSSYNQITISGTIDGASSKKLATQNEVFEITSDGTNWKVTAHSYPLYLGTFTITPTNTVAPNPTKGTVVNDLAQAWRYGDQLKECWNYQQSAAGANGGAGTYLINLVSSALTIDTTKTPLSTSADANLSVGESWGSFSTGSTMRPGPVKAYDSTHLAMVAVSGEVGTMIGGAMFSLGTTGTTTLHFCATVAITGWEN